MPNTETPLQNEIMLALSEVGITVWRNTVGMGWAGKVTHLADNRVIIDNAFPLRAGLCEGSSDLIGIRSVVITQEMVGTVIGQFVAVEVKTPGGRTSPKQRNFLKRVREKRGIAVVARSPEEATEGMDKTCSLPKK